MFCRERMTIAPDSTEEATKRTTTFPSSVAAYGSMTEDGISYTEQEFDLGTFKTPVLVFVPKDPDSIPQADRQR